MEEPRPGTPSTPAPLPSPAPGPISLAGFARREWPIVAIVAAQFLLVCALLLVTPGLWPIDDDVTYIDQALMLRLGLFPPDPTRPIFYPFLLSLAMRLFGFNPALLAWTQGLLLVATTLLLYRLARRLAGRRAAIVATLLFASWPAALFYSARFYKESPTGFFLLAALNLIELMLAHPRRRIYSVLAGVLAGMLVMMRAEYGLLLAFMALSGFAADLRGRELGRRTIPWILAGAFGLLTVSPAALAARVAFGEWVFLSTYTGFTYSWSFCGELPENGKSFWLRDGERTAQVAPKANQVMYFSAPSIPYSRRDRFLLEKAKQCVRDRPRQTAYLIANRFLLAAFSLDHIAADMIRSGQFGDRWPPALAQALHLGDWSIQFLCLLLLLPGMWFLHRRPEGRPFPLVAPWFVLYYSTVYFACRYRVPLLPALALIAGAGVEFVLAAVKTRSARVWAAMGGWALLCILGVGVVSHPWRSRLFVASGWSRLEIHPGLDEAKRSILLRMFADDYGKSGRSDLRDLELSRFIRRRSSWISPALLLGAGDVALRQAKVDSATFFYRQALDLDAKSEADARLAAIAARRRAVDLSAFDERGRTPALTIYSASLPEPALLDPVFPPAEMKLTIFGRPLRFNPGMPKEQGLAPDQFYLKDRGLWVSLAPSDPPPSAKNPVRLTYFAALPETPKPE